MPCRLAAGRDNRIAIPGTRGGMAPRAPARNVPPRHCVRQWGVGGAWVGRGWGVFVWTETRDTCVCSQTSNIALSPRLLRTLCNLHSVAWETVVVILYWALLYAGDSGSVFFMQNVRRTAGA